MTTTSGFQTNLRTPRLTPSLSVHPPFPFVALILVIADLAHCVTPETPRIQTSNENSLPGWLTIQSKLNVENISDNAISCVAFTIVPSECSLRPWSKTVLSQHVPPARTTLLPGQTFVNPGTDLGQLVNFKVSTRTMH